MSDELVAALIGGLAVAIVASIQQHRQWVRDTRREVYAHILVAHDRMNEAAQSYVNILQSLEDAPEDLPPAFHTHLHELGEERHASYSQAKDELARVMSEVELVGSTWATRSLTFLRWQFVGVWSAHWPDSDRSEVIARWDDGADARKTLRQTFVEGARAELEIDVPLRRRVSRRLRSVRMSARGRWELTKRRFRRDEQR